MEVSVFKPLAKSFHYAVNSELQELPAGSLLELPFGRGKCQGISLAKPVFMDAPKEYRLREIGHLFDEAYGLTPELLKLAHWMSEYYLCPLGEVLSSFSCSSASKKPSSLENLATKLRQPGPQFSEAQQSVFDAVVNGGAEKPFLIHGITGSGKTEIYLNLVERELEAGRSSLFLLPEITLTQETMRKIKTRFDNILVFHSAMSVKQRRETWLQVKEHGPHLIVGPRSALFSPVKNLGLIVVDEEHDSSYKQEQNPRYRARDVAVMRAKMAGAKIVLGSATPSMESYQNALSGKYRLLKLDRRISPHPLPKVHMVDLRDEMRDMKMSGGLHFSRKLLQLTEKHIKRKKQVIFFLNRRGFSTQVVCSACGEKVRCTNCSVDMIYYKNKNQLRCHHCEYSRTPPRSCELCPGGHLVFRGTGTEKIHELLEKFFKNYDVVRVDGAQQKLKDHRDQLEKFMNGEGDILIGTQIIGKGLDSDRIAFSAAINADQDLALPDFRAAERDFQILTQLAGRSGRGDDPGECLFQAYHPDHYVLTHAIKHDYESFYRTECEFRKKLNYPPFTRLARLVFQSTNEDKLMKNLNLKGALLRSDAKRLGVEMLGPAPAPLQKIKNKFRWHILIKSPSVGSMTRFLKGSRLHFEDMSNIDVVLDRDPVNMM